VCARARVCVRARLGVWVSDCTNQGAGFLKNSATGHEHVNTSLPQHTMKKQTCYAPKETCNAPKETLCGPKRNMLCTKTNVLNTKRNPTSIKTACHIKECVTCSLYVTLKTACHKFLCPMNTSHVSHKDCMSHIPLPDEFQCVTCLDFMWDMTRFYVSSIRINHV